MQTKLNFYGTNPIDQLSNITALETATLPRHRWYYFKEAFSPNLVECAIADAKCEKDDLILDAFSGSGTVALTSASQGYSAVGCEVNPFLAFVSKVKLLNSTSEKIKAVSEKILDGIHCGAVSPLESFSTFSENGKIEKWLFNKPVLRAFEGGWQATIGKHDPARSILRLCLVGAAMDVANAVKDGKCLRYRSDWKDKNFGADDFIAAFRNRIESVEEDVTALPLQNPDVSIQLGDSRQIGLSNLNNKKFKLCVMSPPYLNSFDYTDVYRPELFLSKFVNTPKDLQALRFKTLRSHVQVNWAKPNDLDFGPHFSESFNEIVSQGDNLWNPRIPFMVQAYFEDMKQVLTNLKAVSRPDATIWIVVSTSAYAGIEIPVDLIIADIGTQVGWFLREVKVMRYLKRVSGQQWNELNRRKDNKPHLRESIIILDGKPRT